jgi:hypothetical protein
MKGMTQHLGQSHREAATELATAIASAAPLIASYLLVSRYVQIPAGETKLQEIFELNEQTLYETLIDGGPGPIDLNFQTSEGHTVNMEEWINRRKGNKSAAGGAAPSPPGFSASPPKMQD